MGWQESKGEKEQGREWEEHNMGAGREKNWREGEGEGERKPRLSSLFRSELSACHLKTPDGNSLPSSASCPASLFFVS